MAESNAAGAGEFPLSDEHRMLLLMRDTLYEGSWDDFQEDLRARAEDRPHVFDTVPPSPGMRQAIARHIRLIDEMWTWELRAGRTLRADGP
ncbi:MAG: hypothetical protein HY763_12555 [Planctomycetes bacterium]|nr:hypothetical protein [Planctomycetota bacterium]